MAHRLYDFSKFDEVLPGLLLKFTKLYFEFLNFDEILHDFDEHCTKYLQGRSSIRRTNQDPQ